MTSNEKTISIDSFPNGEVNIVTNCVDRYFRLNGEKKALHWYSSHSDHREYSYAELNREVKQMANALLGAGAKRGNTIAICLPAIPERLIATLACFKVGLVALPLEPTLSIETAKQQLANAKVKIIFTADGFVQNDEVKPIKAQYDAIFQEIKGLKTMFVVEVAKNEIEWTEGKNVWWHEAKKVLAPACGTYPLPQDYPAYLRLTDTGEVETVTHGTCLEKLAGNQKDIRLSDPFDLVACLTLLFRGATLQYPTNPADLQATG